ncbi:hypothetical protein ABIC06_008092 [Bradyrhizobium sp. RT7b]
MGMATSKENVIVVTASESVGPMRDEIISATGLCECNDVPKWPWPS